MKRIPFLAGITCTGLLALYLGFGLPVALRMDLWLDGSVAWSLLCLAGLFGAMVLQAITWRHDPAPLQNSRWVDFGIAAGLTVLIALVVPGRAMIEADESNLLATAQRITYDHSPASVVHGIYKADGSLVSLAESMDKRGVMFPTMIAAVNMVVGDRPENPILLNLILAGLTLFASARLARRFLPGHLAALAPVLLAAFGAFTITARGGTFDIANILLLILLAHLCCSAIIRPASSATLLLVLIAVVVAQLRYESLLLAAAVMGALVLIRLRGDDPQRPWLLLLMPLAFIPGVWRFAFPISLEMGDSIYQAWSVQNVPDNLLRLAAWLWSPAGAQTGNQFVGLLALVGAIALGMRSLRTRDSKVPVRSLSVPMLLLTVLTCVYMASYWGNAMEVTTVRYFIPHALAAAILALLGLQWLLQAARANIQRIAASVLALLILILQLPILREAKAYQTLYLSAHRDQLNSALNRVYGPCSVLVLTPHSAQIISRQRSSMSPRAYQTIGLDRLQQIASGELRAVVFDLPLRGNEPFISPEQLAAWNYGHTVYDLRQPSGWGLELVQLWPDVPINTATCKPAPKLQRIVHDADYPPRQTWMER